jgi:MFS family permease
MNSFLAGLGVGQMSLLAPLYQSEIAHPSIRGRLTTLQQFCLGIGALVASIIAYELEKNHKGTVFQWRFPLGFQIVPAVPLACLIFLFPEVSQLYS